MSKPHSVDGRLGAHEQIEVWDRLWQNTGTTLEATDVYAAIDQAKLGHVLVQMPAPPATVLEVGCGSARASSLLAAIGYETYGVDYSHAALECAARNYDQIERSARLVQAVGERMPFPDAKFDVVFSTGLLEHFEQPLPIVREMVRVLKSGGLFWSDIVPRKFSLLRLFEPIRTALKGPEVYERAFTKTEIRELLYAAGLSSDAAVFGAGVFPPLWIPVISRSSRYRALHGRIAMRFSAWSKRLDGTLVADILGFYYLCWTRKP